MHVCVHRFVCVCVVDMIVGVHTMLVCVNTYVCVCKCWCWCVGHCVCIGVGVWRFVCVSSTCSSTCVTVYHITSNVS